MPDQSPNRIAFPDLAGPAAEATQPPPFEHVVARAQRHRRRTRLTTGIVAAVVVAAVAGGLLTTGKPEAGPQPVEPSPSVTSSPSPTPTQSSEERAARIARDGQLISYAVNAKGSLLTVWQLCSPSGRCGTAWQLQSRSGVHRGVVHGSPAAATAVGDFLVVASRIQSGGVVVEDDGGVRPLQEVASRAVSAGNGVVRLGRKLGVVDPVAATFWFLPLPTGAAGWVDGTISGATVWAIASRPVPPVDVRVSRLAPGGSPNDWQEHTLSTSYGDGVVPGALAVAGDHVAVISLHDGVDVAAYGRFSVTTDAGASWTDLRPGDLPFDNVDAMAATAKGTLYVATTDSSGEGRVFRSTDATWRQFVEVPGARGSFGLVAAGSRVVAARGTAADPELLKLDDAGRATLWARFTN